MTGHIDLANAGELDRELLRVEATDAIVITLDLAGPTFIDSTGIRMLIDADTRSRADSNRLQIRGASHQVRRVLRIAGVHDRLPLSAC